MPSAEKKDAPEWSFEQQYYDSLTSNEGVAVKTDPVKGKCMYATRDFAVGEEVLVETALACTQNMDEVRNQIPCCNMCLRSLETPRGIVARNTRNKAFAQRLPRYDHYRTGLNPVNCRHQAEGCNERFCSVKCMNAAWKSHHFALCRGRMTPDGQEAYDEFLNETWQASGIDFSDTIFLGLRIVGATVTECRLKGIALEQAYHRFDLLIKVLWEKFTFGYLLDDDPNEAWLAFQKYKADPHANPKVAEVEKESPTKSDLIAKALKLMKTMLQFTEGEESFFDRVRWSNLLGMILLNGQERTPNSPYVEWSSWLSDIEGGESELSQYESEMRCFLSDISPCSTSTRGQGLYTIGSCFNHSCEPNVQISYNNDNDETLMAICIRPIKEGEECFISYISESDPFRVRQQHLYEHYFFDCLCTKCTADMDSKSAERDGAPSVSTASES